MTKVKVSDFMQLGYEGTALFKISKDGKEFADKFYKANYLSIAEDERPFITNEVKNATLSISCIDSVKKLGDLVKTKIEQLDNFTSNVIATVKTKKILNPKSIVASVDELPEDITLSSLKPINTKPGDILEIKGLLDIDFD